jgi:hypothetical protein
MGSQARYTVFDSAYGDGAAFGCWPTSGAPIRTARRTCT